MKNSPFKNNVPATRRLPNPSSKQEQKRPPQERNKVVSPVKETPKTKPTTDFNQAFQELFEEEKLIVNNEMSTQTELPPLESQTEKATGQAATEQIEAAKRIAETRESYADGLEREPGWNKKKNFKYPKYKRSKITELDLEVLSVAALSGVITEKQADIVLNSKRLRDARPGKTKGQHRSAKTIQARLYGLAEMGMLQRSPLLTQSVYVLTNKATHYLTEVFGMHEDQITLVGAESVVHELRHHLARSQWLSVWSAQLPVSFKKTNTENVFFISEAFITSDSRRAWGVSRADEMYEDLVSDRREFKAMSRDEQLDELAYNPRLFNVFNRNESSVVRPDGVIFRPDGKHIAVEIETTKKGRKAYERVFGAYLDSGAQVFQGVQYVISSPEIANAIRKSENFQKLQGNNFISVTSLKDVDDSNISTTDELWKL